MKLIESDEIVLGRLISRAKCAVLVAGIMKDKIDAEMELDVLNRLIENANINFDELYNNFNDKMRG